VPDSTAASAALDMAATPIEESLAETVRGVAPVRRQSARSGAGSPSASAISGGISRLPEPSVATTT
jgi:hypothetical protein